jgi:FAD/FMN-containing dehydrogenase
MAAAIQPLSAFDSPLIPGALYDPHGRWCCKKGYFQDLEHPDKLDLLRRVKTAFDPNGILNRGVVFDWPSATA